jgi:hypothetical protein
MINLYIRFPFQTTIQSKQNNFKEGLGFHPRLLLTFTMKKEYYLVKDFIGWDKTEKFVQDLILKHNLKSILEVGAGANPTIRPEFINKHQINYVISDVDDV